MVAVSTKKDAVWFAHFTEEEYQCHYSLETSMLWINTLGQHKHYEHKRKRILIISKFLYALVIRNRRKPNIKMKSELSSAAAMSHTGHQHTDKALRRFLSALLFFFLLLKNISLEASNCTTKL